MPVGLPVGGTGRGTRPLFAAADIRPSRPRVEEPAADAGEQPRGVLQAGHKGDQPRSHGVQAIPALHQGGPKGGPFHGTDQGDDAGDTGDGELL